MSADLTVAVVGLSFGAEFVPIYQAHPEVGTVVLCDPDAATLERIGDRYGVTDRRAGLDAVLDDPTVDAVHLVTPLHVHADQAVAALKAGKHTACTVPMALSLDDLRRVVDATESSGLVYMMMETAVYTREFLHARDLVAAGRLGRIAYGRGAHFQDMSGWPSYWRGLPPMHYMTHAVAPLLSLLDTTAESVRCVGSGRHREDEDAYGNPFAAESALFTLRGTDVAVDVVRSLRHVARPYTEAFSLYGDRGGFEWPQLEGTGPALWFEMGDPRGDRGRAITTTEVEPADRTDLLPAELAPFTRSAELAGEGHRSFVQGGGHGGSHPHLVHEFVSSVVEGRPSAVDAARAAAWTAAGICAHTSAMSGGTVVEVPDFTTV